MPCNRNPKLFFGLLKLAVILSAMAAYLPSDLYGIQNTVSSDPVFSNALKQQLDWAVTHHLLAGVAVAVIDGDEIVFMECCGLADSDTKQKVSPETIFYIASATKSLTGLAVNIGCTKHGTDLDQTLDQLLPDAEFHVDIDPAAISLRQLLTHSHGIANDGPVTFRTAFSGQHSTEQLKHLMHYHGASESRNEFHYGNIGYVVAGLAIENKWNTSWKELLHSEVLNPLKMTSTAARVSSVDPNKRAMPHRFSADGFEQLPYGKSDSNMHAAGGVVTNVGDMAVWLKANINRGLIDGQQLIPSSFFDIAQSTQAIQNEMRNDFHATGYGLGWNVGKYGDQTALWQHGGFIGFGSHVSFLPDRKLGVVVLTNSDAGNVVADAIARFVYDSGGKLDTANQSLVAALSAIKQQFDAHRSAVAADRVRRDSRPKVPRSPLESFVGIYENEFCGQIEIGRLDDRLKARMGPLQSDVETFDAEQDILRMELFGSGETAHFKFDADSGLAQEFSMGGNRYQRIQIERTFRKTPDSGISIGDSVDGLKIPVLLQADGKTAVNLTELRGSTVVVEFWSTWCAPCIKAIDPMNQLISELPEQNRVVFLFVTDETKETVEPFLKRKPVNGWVGLDSTGSIHKAFNITSIPRTLVINPEGKLAASVLPGQLSHELINRVRNGELTGLQMDPELTLPGVDPQRPDQFGNGDNNAIMYFTLRESTALTGNSAESESALTLLRHTPQRLIEKIFKLRPGRTEFSADLPDSGFDLIARFPKSSNSGFLQVAVASAFNVQVTSETRLVDVLVVAQSETERSLLTPTVSTGGRSSSIGSNNISILNGTISDVLDSLEIVLETPVMNSTDLDGKYDFDMQWSVSATSDEIAQQFATATGLTITRQRREIPMTVIRTRNDTKK